MSVLCAHLAQAGTAAAEREDRPVSVSLMISHPPPLEGPSVFLE